MLYIIQVTLVNLKSDETQIADGNKVEDIDGSRTATLMFNPGTTVTVVDENNNTQVLSKKYFRGVIQF